MAAVPKECKKIAQEYESARELADELRKEWENATGQEKSRAFYLWRQANSEALRLAASLEQCVNPPPVLPDLFAQSVFLKVNHQTRKLNVFTRTINIGQGNARGPFRIDLAATLIRGGTTTSIVRVFEVPSDVVILGELVLAPPDLAPPEAKALIGDITPSQEYVTDGMEIPLYYFDESPSCRYEFEFLVDSEQVIAETNHGNNRFCVPWWTTTPTAIQRDTPFIIESSSTFQVGPSNPGMNLQRADDETS